MFHGSSAVRLGLAWAVAATVAAAVFGPGSEAGPAGPFDRLDPRAVAPCLRVSAAAGAVVGVLGRRGGPPADQIWCAAVSPDGQWVAAANPDRSLRLYEVPSWRCAWDRDGAVGRVTALAFAADGQTVMAGDLEGYVRRWTLDGTPAPGRGPFRAHPTAVQAVAESPDGRTLATAALGCVRLWREGRTDGPAEEIPVPDCLVSAVAFSPDGRWLACGGGGPVPSRLWRLGDGKPQPGPAVADHGGRYVRALAFSPDGSALASLDSEGCGAVDDLSGGRLGGWCVPMVNCLRGSFAADGRHYVAVAADGAARVVRLRERWSGPYDDTGAIGPGPRGDP
ncbi:MAG TPA: hypothetical protein VGF55_09785 [Gemmataceae bacterium]|jgi:hypothetical protein